MWADDRKIPTLRAEPLPQHCSNPLDGLLQLLLGLEEAEADVIEADGAEAGTGEDRDLRLVQQVVGHAVAVPIAWNFRPYVDAAGRIEDL